MQICRAQFSKEKHLHGKLVYAKLDRVSGDCLRLFPNYLVTNGPCSCSDHAYVLLNIEPMYPYRGATNFRHQYSWAQYQDTYTNVRRN